jgi:hypothetical protein
MSLGEKLNALTTMVEPLHMIVTDLKNEKTPHSPNPNPEPLREDKSMRVDVQDFDGTAHDPEVYIE